MAYNEREELVRTDEFLLNLQLAGYSRELEILPSQVGYLIVPEDEETPPVEDFAIQDHESLDAVLDHGTIEPSVIELERVEVFVGRHDASQESASQDNGVVFDYENYDPWEWFNAYENMIVESETLFSSFEDDLHIFNELVSDKVGA